MKTCKACGCYIPDLWETCPGCGAIDGQKSDSGGRFAPSEYEDVSGRGGQAILHFRDPRPLTVIKYGDNDMEDLNNLDNIESIEPYISLELIGLGYGRELSKIPKPPTKPTVFTRADGIHAIMIEWRV